MRIGVVSDSHGRVDLLRHAVEEMHEIDLLIHAGDFYKDALALKPEIGIPIYSVLGNCDGFATGPEEETIELEGCKIFVTHGHRYGVKSGHEQLVGKIQREGYDLVIFGHTHIAELIPVGSSYIFNPGSIARPRIGKRTFGIVELKEGKLFPHIKEASG